MINIPVEPAITEFLHKKAAVMRIPLSGTFELTPVCNMDCKMCYIRMSKQQQQSIAPLRTAQEWIELAREAKEMGLLFLLLTGGEPFLHPEFKTIFQQLHEMGFVLMLNTNGTLIDEKTVQWLKQTPPNRINITLYGASDETYARLCGNPHGFTQATKALRMLRDAGISVRINCSLTPHNAEDAEAIYQFAKDEGFLVQGSAYMFPPLRRDESQVGRNDRFSPEEAAYHSAKIISLLNGDQYFLDLLEKGLPPIPAETEDCPDVASEGEGIRCRAGKCSFWITWKGEFMACGMLPEPNAPNAFEVGFAKGWQYAKDFVDAIRLPAKCAECNARDNCKACAAMVYTESGNFHTVPEYRCNMTKAYPAACLKLKNEILSRHEK